jgi:hypothetical protein
MSDVTRESAGRFTIPRGQWFATRLEDVAGPDPLSRHARTVLDLALAFPHFQAPGVDEIHELHRHTEAASGSGYKPYGRVRIKEAIAELKIKGFYGIRRASLGRAVADSLDSTNKVRLAFARSYGNEPEKHLALLAALTPDQIRAHDRAARDGWKRYLATGMLPGRGEVISLQARRIARAG